MELKVSFSKSKQPEILRAYQRDDEYKLILRYMIIESLETFINYRTISKYDAELKMLSDLTYYLLTTIRGKLTLGEEYCSIIPVSNSTDNFPSLAKRIAFCLLNITGPYYVNKLLKKVEQPLNQYVVDLANKIQSKKTPTLGELIKSNLLLLLPDIFASGLKTFTSLHLALFFIWGKYYELAKRLIGIHYKYVQGSEGQHMIEYLKPGRFIMAQLVFQSLVILYKIIKSIYQSYQKHKKIQEKVQQDAFLAEINKGNPQEDYGKNQEIEQQQEEQKEAEQCVLCYGSRINTTATACGHLFCWDCIHTSLKVKGECPQCREPGVQQKQNTPTLVTKCLNFRSFSFVSAQDYDPEYKQRLEDQHLVKSDKEYRFAIVGCGPAGFYCAKQILKNVKKVRVDIFDRNPHPYGLVRTGVAPDHPEMKKIENDYAEVLRDTERCKFFGNVWVGTNDGVTVDQLKQMYSGVVFSYGATSERKLGLPNEYSLKGVLSSRKLANWYNGSLDQEPNIYQDLDLQNVRDVAIIGNGNVAMDITRILMKDPAKIAPFDIPSTVVEELQNSGIKNLQIVGRRGVVQSAFTIKEIREVSRIDKIKLYIMREEFENSMNEHSRTEMGAGFSVLSRGISRRTDFIKDTCTFIDSEEQLQEILNSNSGAQKKIILRYLLNPCELIGDPKTNRISQVKLQKMQLNGDAGVQKAVPNKDSQTTLIDTQLLIKSIGYQSKPIQGLPFDSKSATVPNNQGCVIDQGQPQPGLYVSGWLKRGPMGIIDSTLRDSVDTFRIIKHHLEHDMLPEKKSSVADILSMVPKGQKVISYEDWLKIDQVERERGQVKGKTREKILDKEEMLRIVS